MTGDYKCKNCGVEFRVIFMQKKDKEILCKVCQQSMAELVGESE